MAFGFITIHLPSPTSMASSDQDPEIIDDRVMSEVDAKIAARSHTPVDGSFGHSIEYNQATNSRILTVSYQY